MATMIMGVFVGAGVLVGFGVDVGMVAAGVKAQPKRTAARKKRKLNRANLCLRIRTQFRPPCGALSAF